MRIYRSSRLWLLIILFFSVAQYDSFCEAHTPNLLPNGGFAQCKAGEKTPVHDWLFNYNKEVTGRFIKDNAFKGNGPVLEMTNNSAKEPISLINRKQTFKISEPGKYRITMWAKSGKNSKEIPGKKSGLKLFAVKTDWKIFYTNKPPLALRNNWVEYEFEFDVANDKVGAYFFRADIAGTGTYYAAEPKLIRLDVNLEARVKGSLRATSRFEFENVLTDNSGKISPSKSDKTEFAAGFTGKGITVKDGGHLSYPLDGLLRGESGAVALWIKTSKDPTPAFTPTDMVGFSISGNDESGNAKDKIIHGQISSAGIQTSFKGAFGSGTTNYNRPPKTYYANEWRHYIFTWDYSDGMKIYIDGRVYVASAISDKGFKGLSKVELKNINLYTATGRIAEEKATFDDILLFNRSLSSAEAKSLYEKYIPAYPVLLDYATVAGSNNPFRVKMVKTASIPETLLTAKVENLDGRKMFEQKILVKDSSDYEINFYPDDCNDYRLSFIYNNKPIRTYEITAVPAESITENMPVVAGIDGKKILIDEVDCTKEYPAERYIDDGEVKVVNSPIGKYRESTRTTFNFQSSNGFVYHFKIKNPGRPHWLEIEYPDDMPRVFFVVVDQKLLTHGWGKNKYTQTVSLDTIGIANGINNPVTNAFSKKQLLFWPDSDEILVASFGYKTFAGCRGPAMKAIRIFENDGPLPKIEVNTPKDMPQRRVGNWNEDPAMPATCWFNRFYRNKGPEFSFWKEKLRRRIEYINATAQNETILQIFDYGGDNNGGFAYLANSVSSDFMPGWANLAATMLDREKIPFYIQFNDRGNGMAMMVGPDKISRNIYEASAKGTGALELITADGSLIPITQSVTLNFLQPEVREAHLRRIGFYRDQFKIYNNFKGISYWYSKSIIFKNEKVGYGDYTTALFEKETGIKIPVNEKGIIRYKKRYDWLKNSRAWDKWIDWRCAKVEDFLLALTNELNKGGNDYKLIIPLQEMTELPANCGNLTGSVDLYNYYRTMGLNILSLNKHPSLVMETVIKPNYGILYRKGIQTNLDSLWYSDDFVKLLENNQSRFLMLSRHSNMEIYGSRTAKIKGYWWPRGYWAKNDAFHCFSTALPVNKYLPQTLTWMLAYGDVKQIDHGWWGNPENGAHNEFQKFYRAYRTIPATNFVKAPGVNDPVMVRNYNDEKAGWIYLVNTQYYKTGVKISFGDEAVLENTISRKISKTNDNALTLELEPYDVVCFRSDTPLEVNAVKQIVPEDVRNEFSGIVSNLKAGAMLTGEADDKKLAAKAAWLLKQKRYSSLYYLSRSFSVQQLLEESKKQVTHEASLNLKPLGINLKSINRSAQPHSIKMVSKKIPAGVSISIKNKEYKLNESSDRIIEFPISGIQPSQCDGKTEFLFQFEYTVDDSDPFFYELVFRPVVCNKINNIIVDGDLSDWKENVWTRLSSCHKNVSIGLRDDREFAAFYSVGWNTDGLALAVKVDDNNFITSPTTNSAWHYDYFEFMIDQKNNAPAKSGEIDRDDYIFNVANIGQKYGVLTLATHQGQREDLASLCKIKALRKDNQTTYEIFIPAKVLEQINFERGNNIGFALKLHNRDHTENTAQDSWGYKTSTVEYPCNNPSVWNDLILTVSAES